MQQYYLHDNLADGLEIAVNKDLTTDMMALETNKEITEKALNNKKTLDILQMVKYKEATGTDTKI